MSATADSGRRTNYWRGGDGLFQVAANWSDASFYPSTSNDCAIFSARKNSQVVFKGNITNCNAQVRGFATDVNWDLDGHTYTLIASASGTSPFDAGLLVGFDGEATLRIAHGHLDAPRAGIVLGRHNQSSGRLVFSGPDTGFSGGQAYIGLSHGLSVLQLDHGAHGQIANLLIGHGGDRRGGLILLGEGTSLTTTWSVVLGSSGHGLALVADGAEWHARNIRIGHAAKASADNSAMLHMDNGRILVQDSVKAGIVSNYLMLTLQRGVTNPALVVGGDFDVSSGTTVLQVSLADDFEAAPCTDMYKLVQANAAGGNNGFKGHFMDADLNAITNGALLTASNWRTGLAVRFVACYTDDGCFTLTPDGEICPARIP